MQLALVQIAASLAPADNRASLDHLPAADLVVLPEAFARDFGKPGSDISAFAEDLEGPFVTAIVKAAGDRTIVAGMFERSADPSRPFNTVVVADRTGIRAAYRKVHLYDSFGYQESLVLTPGEPDQLPVVEIAGAQVGIVTCYDLRFPEIVRRYAGIVDLLVVPAAWVAGPRKVHHWRTLLTARAIENLMYVAGAAQPGPRYSGTSLIVDPRGDVLAEAGVDAETISAVIDPTVVAAARQENSSLANRRF